MDTELSEEAKTRKSFVGAVGVGSGTRLRATFDLQQALTKQKPVPPDHTENLAANFE